MGKLFAQRLGELIKKARVCKGLSQKQLAWMVGVTRGSIVNYENGSSEITFRNGIRLVKILQIKYEAIDELLWISSSSKIDKNQPHSSVVGGLNVLKMDTV